MKQRVFYEEFEPFYYYNGNTQDWNMEGFHFHKNYEIILFMSEGASIYINDRVFKVKKGDLFLINNREYHKTEGVEGKEYKRFVLMFDPEPIVQLGTTMGYSFTKYFEEDSEDFIHMIRFSEEHLTEIIKLFQKIEALHLNCNTKHDNMRMTLAMLELIVYVNQQFDFLTISEERGKEHELILENSIEDRELIEQIKKYINANIENKLDLVEIADYFYMNKYYLSHYFKKKTGFTMSQYISNCKIAAAKTMLKKGYSVTETAVALSYNSDSHFVSIFKKMTGTTPKKWSQE
ncbi:MAG TPA: AraC family transcriptional regulator [Lachnoclostridium phytofermentans]|uniref:AraC family transcriptional regulator n=1 Tax=Lachnoclostridium phytofermentans TaxID=66219 RepID=A0A3D2XC98_9FIRM|nr:AraC family transcriptional regulator [Lachnoclostridium sp.]HCL04377.1 AraC family transcriptional regulator [Lachnoclostridium phytofermentans]